MYAVYNYTLEFIAVFALRNYIWMNFLFLLLKTFLKFYTARYRYQNILYYCERSAVYGNRIRWIKDLKVAVEIFWKPLFCSFFNLKTN